MNKEVNVVLSLYPNTRGLGFACIDIPQTLLDFGIVTIRPISNHKILRRVKGFIEYYQPKIIVMRECGGYNRCYSERTIRLLAEIIALAKERQIPVFQYSRKQIQETFELFGAKTKYEVSQKLIEWFPILSIRTPKLRKAWMDEDYNMGIFDALALAVTHQNLSE